MPRSGGGGSHSGGSHHSSHSHSSSGRSRSRHSYGSLANSYMPRYSKTYYPGACRFAYYNKSGQLRDYYGTDKVKKPNLFVTIGVIVFGVVFILIGAALCLPITYEPQKIVEYPQPAFVVDETGRFDETDNAQKTLQKFTDQTGITVAVVSIRNESWQGYYQDLESCAYDIYVNTFNNEKSLLIVYSEPTVPDPAFLDWHFEIMYGNDTEILLSQSRINSLREEIQKALTIKGNKPELAISSAVDKIGVGIMDTQHFWLFLIVAVPFMLAGVCIIIKAVRIYTKDSIESTAVVVNHDAPEKVCEYCGRHYIVGMSKTCQSCGAPIDLTVEGVRKDSV